MKTKLLFSVLALTAFGSVLIASPTYAIGKGAHHFFTSTATRQMKLDNRLNELVKQGKITEAQKTLIENKLKEVKDAKIANKANLKNMTKDQRKALRQQELTDLQNWAKQNGIDPTYLFGGNRMWHKATK